MPIDWNQPLELDNGVPVRFIKDDHDCVVVRLPAGQHQRRDGGVKDENGFYTWSYFKDTGVWTGGTAEHYYVLRNVRDNPKDLEFDV